MNLAVFDFDGTITSNNTWAPFLKFALSPSRLVVARALLLPVMLGYRFRVVPGNVGRQIANWVAFWRADSSTVRRCGITYAHDVLPRSVRQTAIQRIEWHRSRGDLVVVVSASLDVYLRPWCEANGLACICTTLEERGNRLTGRCIDGDCSGVEKARRLTAHFDLSQYQVVYGYGDTPDDREMLELVHKKYYRWREVSSWDEVTEFEDPLES